MKHHFDLARRYQTSHFRLLKRIRVPAFTKSKIFGLNCECMRENFCTKVAFESSITHYEFSLLDCVKEREREGGDGRRGGWGKEGCNEGDESKRIKT